MTAPATPGRALVVRLSSVGDVVHTLPAAAALRRAGWEVDWLVEPLARPLVEGNPAVAQAIFAPRAARFSLGVARHARSALQARKYDVALDLQGLWKSAAWARLAAARRTVGAVAHARREPGSAWLMNDTIDPRPQVHVIDRTLALLRGVGVDAVGLREFPLPSVPEVSERVSARLQEASIERFAILNPGGGWASKLWPPVAFGAVARHVRDRGLTPVVSWGPGEESLADAVVAASAGAAVRAFPTTLLELVELTRRAELLVAGDTGPLHIACALRTPVVGIFGPTDPARNGPFSPDDVTVCRTPLCSPCHRRACRLHEGVMEAISPEQVTAAVDRRLGFGRATGAL